MPTLKREEVGAWLSNKGISPECPLCKAESNTVGKVVEFSPLKGDNPESKQFYAAVPVICRNCGHIRFFEAKILGLV